MLVKIIEKYKDKEFGEIIPKGVILEVSEARANVLKLNGKAVDYSIVTVTKTEKNSKEEPEIEIKPEVLEGQETIEEAAAEIIEEPVKEPEKKSKIKE